MRTPTSILGIAAGLALVGSVTGGCSSGSNTTCGEYRSMTTADKVTAVTNMIKDHADPKPTPAKVGLTRASVTAYCFIHDGGDNIGNVYGK
jgi:hypothetical protein